MVQFVRFFLLPSFSSLLCVNGLGTTKEAGDDFGLNDKVQFHDYYVGGAWIGNEPYYMRKGEIQGRIVAPLPTYIGGDKTRYHVQISPETPNNKDSVGRIVEVAHADLKLLEKAEKASEAEKAEKPSGAPSRRRFRGSSSLRGWRRKSQAGNWRSSQGTPQSLPAPPAPGMFPDTRVQLINMNKDHPGYQGLHAKIENGFINKNGAWRYQVRVISRGTKKGEVFTVAANQVKKN